MATDQSPMHDPEGKLPSLNVDQINDLNSIEDRVFPLPDSIFSDSYLYDGPRALPEPNEYGLNLKIDKTDLKLGALGVGSFVAGFAVQEFQKRPNVVSGVLYLAGATALFALGYKKVDETRG